MTPPSKKSRPQFFNLFATTIEGKKRLRRPTSHGDCSRRQYDRQVPRSRADSCCVFVFPSIPRAPTDGAIRPAPRYKIYIYFYTCLLSLSFLSYIDDPFSLLERDAAIHDESRANHITSSRHHQHPHHHHLILSIISISSINININSIIIIVTNIFSARSAPSVIIDAPLSINFAPYFTAHIITDTA